ncbi:MAG TPA: hypothetical protein VGS58_07840, partial [Candidatus Sulfopaludibacter sp.]|nr:hypothetical protein [Candidatus Sulfopaludibacter sp.]
MSLQWIEPTGGRPQRRSEASAEAQRLRVSDAMERAAAALFAQQHADGFWCGELTADTTLESDYI